MITHFDADIYWLKRSHSRFLKLASSQTVSRSIVNRFYKQSKNPHAGDDPFLRGLALGLMRTPGERMHQRRTTVARITDRPLRQQLRATVRFSRVAERSAAQQRRRQPVVIAAHPVSISSAWQPQSQVAISNRQIVQSLQGQSQHVHTSAEPRSSCL